MSLELASCVHGASFPIGVNAKCFPTSPTLISFPVALWPLQLWSDEVEKVSTQLNLCSNLLGVTLVFRAGGAGDSFLLVCLAGGDRWDVAVISPILVLQPYGSVQQ